MLMGRHHMRSMFRKVVHPGTSIVSAYVIFVCCTRHADNDIVRDLLWACPRRLTHTRVLRSSDVSGVTDSRIIYGDDFIGDVAVKNMGELTKL